MAAASNGRKVSTLDGKDPESTDFANYFCTYAFIYHQKDMLEDHKRTGQYYNAVMQNKKQFQGKVVLDVGAGSGILAAFAAKAGASKVYAVEATSMAQHARRLVEHNKLGGIVEVIQGTIETVQLPEKVDIIISEWMGYFLLRESMLDSVLLARDRFLKPGGALYPSHARMYLAPIRTHLLNQRSNDLQGSMEGWAEFLHDMRSMYGMDLDCLTSDFRQEQKQYYLSTAMWVDVHPSQMLGPAAMFKNYDLHTLTLEELKDVQKASISMEVTEEGPVEAFAGWFDVTFAGSAENPADLPVELTTRPDPTGCTHWGQQVFCIEPELDCKAGTKLEGTIEVSRQKANHRLLEVKLDLLVGENGKRRVLQYQIE